VHVLVVGLNHRTAPLWIRERVAFAPDDGALDELRRRTGLAEVFVLSTCNRVELYGVCDAAEAEGTIARVTALLARRARLADGALRPYLFVYEGAEAVAHLCHVAAGMDSMVLGETQIVSQIKRGLADARRRGTATSVLLRLVSVALGAGKRARPRLPASEGPTSIAGAAVRAIGGIAALNDARVVVIGAGATAVDVLRSIAGARPRRIVLVNRTLANALPIAARHGAAVASWEALGVVVADADVVFTCTSSTDWVIGPAHLCGFATHPRTIVDLGVPRNVDPAIAGVDGARLVDVDALDTWGARGAGECASHAADEVIAEWTGRFATWLHGRAAAPTITRLRAQASDVGEREVQRALARLGAVTPREAEIVRALASRLVNKLLHQPVRAIAEEAERPELAAAARRLFGVGEEPLGADPALDTGARSARSLAAV
jgi:glutamyl-tRNA reductase